MGEKKKAGRPPERLIIEGDPEEALDRLLKERWRQSIEEWQKQEKRKRKRPAPEEPD